MADSQIPRVASKQVRPLGSVPGELGPGSGEESAQNVCSTLG